MDPLKLATAEADAEEWEQSSLLIGSPDEDRQPELEFESFDVTRLTTAVSPDCSFRLVRDAVAAAQSELLLYIYNIGAQHLVSCLTEAVDRGVRMRVMYDTLDQRGGEKEAIQQLSDLGVETLPAPSSGKRRVFTVCHQKFMVIDKQIVLLGSANWAASSIPEITVAGKFKKGNREWLIRIDDASVAKWFRALFEADWDIPEMEGAGAAVEIPPELLQPVAVPAALVKTPGTVFDIRKFNSATLTPVVSPDNYYTAVRKALEGAQSSIDIQQQYILAGGRVSDLLKIVEQRRAAGVEVRVIVSPAFRKVGAKDNWELSRETLDAFGLADCLRALSLSYFTHCHNKGVIVDRSTVVVSSTNWSKNSIQAAREAGLLIESQDVAEYYATVFDLDWSELSWDQADLPNNLMQLASSPGGVVSVDGIDWV